MFPQGCLRAGGIVQSTPAAGRAEASRRPSARPHTTAPDDGSCRSRRRDYACFAPEEAIVCRSSADALGRRPVRSVVRGDCALAVVR